MEKFKNVPGFKGDIMAGDEGNILSIVKDDYLKPYYQSNQLMVEVCNRNGRVTQEPVANLVAKTHVENPNPGLFDTVWFKDGNSANCKANNLEWQASQTNNTIRKEKIDMGKSKVNKSKKKNKGQSTNYTAFFKDTITGVTYTIPYHGIDAILADTLYKSSSSINDRIRDQKPIQGFCPLEGYRIIREDKKTEALENPKAPFRVNPHPKKANIDVTFNDQLLTRAALAP